ncbi:hypothetical protein [Streptomyces sp. LN704]|uniref:hypothetical protein n=1 Tax=Streptomyces sp. LN704 TaxID=3112982 RepID=UPI0037196A8A
MRWPFVSCQRHEREINALAADRDRIRGERNQFAADRDAYRAAAQTAAGQFTEADGQLAAARARLSEYGGRRTASDVLVEHDVHRKALADALGEGWHLNWDQLLAAARRTVETAGEWKKDHDGQKQRADLLEMSTKALRDALNEQRDKHRPIDGGSPQPIGATTRLRRAKAHAAALHERLAEVTAANQACTCGGGEA